MGNIVDLYAIKDRALDAFMAPFIAQSTGSALRAFTDAINDSQIPMNKHPEDYDLYHIGQFDQENGALTSSEKGASQLARGKDVFIPKGK